jgi:hypothetical protein
LHDPLPVKIQSLAVGTDEIAFSGEPILDCRLSERLADWIGNVVQPLARHHLGAGLASVETGPGYVCRSETTRPPASSASTPRATRSTYSPLP